MEAAAIFSSFVKLAEGGNPVVLILFFWLVDRLLGVWERRQSRAVRLKAESEAREARDQIELARIKADRLMAAAIARLTAKIEGAS